MFRSRIAFLAFALLFVLLPVLSVSSVAASGDGVTNQDTWLTLTETKGQVFLPENTALVLIQYIPPFLNKPAQWDVCTMNENPPVCGLVLAAHVDVYPPLLP